MQARASTLLRRLVGVEPTAVRTVRAAHSFGRARLARMAVAVSTMVAAATATAPLSAQTTVSVTGRVTAQGRPVADAQIGVTDTVV